MCRLYTTVCVLFGTHLICPCTNGPTVSTLQNFMQYSKYIILISVHEYMQSPVSVCVWYFQQPLITRLMVEYIMPDPETQKQIRDEHMRIVRQRCDE